MKKVLRGLILFITTFLLLTGCGNNDQTSSSSDGGLFSFGKAGSDLKIVAGSEIEVLEPMIQAYANENNITIEIDYMGSLDMMNLMQTGEMEYDAVWPASSIWIDMGDTQAILVHEAPTSLTPVVFGIEKGLADSLGFNQSEVYLKDIAQAIEEDKLSFAMTSATQSNSGATAYLGFLTAISGQEQLTSEALDDPDLKEQISQLLEGVDRSSGSSNWLVDLYLNGDYDAMVNYEQLIIQTNEELESQGKEALSLVYPVDALSFSDSPLAYVDKGNQAKEETFLAFQDYILSDEGQDLIEQTGKRSANGIVREANRPIFEKWGIDLDKTLSPVPMPQASVIQKALTSFQTEFKKPALTVYVLDFSGSMYGQGHDQMMAALDQVLIPENASQHLLQGTQDDVTYILPFNENVMEAGRADGNGQELKSLYNQAESLPPGGGTALFEAVLAANDLLISEHGDQMDQYQPAIVVLSDGEANGYLTVDEAIDHLSASDYDIPVFTILFGDANPDELEPLAAATNARVFDGRDDLVQAFKSVKGYN